MPFQSAGLAALGIVSGGVAAAAIGGTGNVAAPVAKKRLSTTPLGTIAINDIITTRANSTTTHALTEVIGGSTVTVSVPTQDNERAPNSAGSSRIGYGMFLQSFSSFLT